MGGQSHFPALLPPGKNRYPLYRRLGGPQGRFGRVRKISSPTGIRSPEYINYTSSFVCFLVRQHPSPPLGQGLLIHEVSRSHTTHHTRQDSSVRVISSSQRPLPDNTQKRQTSMPPVGFEPRISAGERPQTTRPLGPD
jgi:hypothetical protein